MALAVCHKALANHYVQQGMMSDGQNNLVNAIDLYDEVIAAFEAVSENDIRTVVDAAWSHHGKSFCYDLAERIVSIESTNSPLRYGVMVVTRELNQIDAEDQRVVTDLYANAASLEKNGDIEQSLALLRQTAAVFAKGLAVKFPDHLISILNGLQSVEVKLEDYPEVQENELSQLSAYIREELVDATTQDKSAAETTRAPELMQASQQSQAPELPLEEKTETTPRETGATEPTVEIDLAQLTELAILLYQQMRLMMAHKDKDELDVWSRAAVHTLDRDKSAQKAFKIFEDLSTLKRRSKAEGAYGMACVCALKNPESDAAKQAAQYLRQAGEALDESTHVYVNRAVFDMDFDAIRTADDFKNLLSTGSVANVPTSLSRL
jgi:hypothetical protein